jgi:hypothetical protein
MPYGHLVQAGADEPLPVQLYKMIFAYRASQAVYVAAKLGLFDHLAGGTRTVAALAEVTETDGPSLERLLRALASLGLASQTTEGGYSPTALGELLRADIPGSYRDVAILYGEEFRWRPWGHLLDSVQSGRAAFDDLYGMGTFEYFAQDQVAGQIFDRGMASFSASVDQAISTAYDFEKLTTLVEVGGGQGSLLRAILRATTNLRGVLFDRREVVDGAHAALASDDLTERCVLIGGDFFQAVPPGGDGYLLKVVLHDWDDERAALILANCRRAMAADGRLLLVEAVIPASDPPFFLPFIDLNMLVVTGGRERTEADFRALLGKTGFRLTRVIPTRSALQLVEALPVA